MKLTGFVSWILKNSTAVSSSEKLTTRKIKKVDHMQHNEIEHFFIFINFSGQNFVREADGHSIILKELQMNSIAIWFLGQGANGFRFAHQ